VSGNAPEDEEVGQNADHIDRLELAGDAIAKHSWLNSSSTLSIRLRLGSRYRSGRSPDWLKMKNPAAPAMKREAEEDWGRGRRR
jgi:hypothetical protein